MAAINFAQQNRFFFKNWGGGGGAAPTIPPVVSPLVDRDVNPCIS